MAVLYYIGTHFSKTKTPPIFNVKGRFYYTPKQIGGSIEVADRDVDELILKAKVFDRKRRQYLQTFTRDPQIAAAIAAKHSRGEETSVAQELSLQEAVGLLDSNEMMSMIASQMSDEDLEKLLEERKKTKSTAAKKETTKSEGDK